MNNGKVLPSTNASVVWCDGHPRVLDTVGPAPVSVALDDTHHPELLTSAQVRARGFSVMFTAPTDLRGESDVAPRTVASVVEIDGRPFVLDGEPDTFTRPRWVGLDPTGAPVIIERSAMSTGVTVLHADPG